MKNIIIIFILSLIISIKALAAGYSITPYNDTRKYMETLRNHKKKYNEVLEDKMDKGIEIYIYRFDFQIIAIVTGSKYIGIVTGLTTELSDIKDITQKIKEEINLLEHQNFSL